MPRMEKKPSQRTTLEEIADRHVLEILKAAARRRPHDLEILFSLGDLFTRLGYIEEGLQVDLTLARLQPRDPTVHYNLACSYALLGRKEEAFAELRKAIRLGYSDPGHMRSDPDLDGLRADPRFGKLLALLERRIR